MRHGMIIAGAVGCMLLAGTLTAAGGYLSEMWAARESINNNEIARCENGDTDCAQKDLPAQVRAAAAGEAMVDLAVWQTLLSALGIGGLLYSLYLTRAAVRAATDAAEDAEAGLTIAREHMTNDLRAWVLPQIVETLQGTDIGLPGARGNAILFSVAFSNAGRTPALRFMVWSELVVTALNDPQPEFSENTFTDDGSGGIMAPGQSLRSHRLPVSGQDRDAFMGGLAAVYMLARVSYRSVFDDKERHTEVCHRIIRNGSTTNADGVAVPYFETMLSGIQKAT